MSARPSLATRLASAAAIEKPQPAAPVSAKSTVPKARSAPAPAVAKARDGKTMVAGYFTLDFARAVRMLAVERGLSVQALIGEGLDAVLRQHGKHPFGER
jgi:hypothetical protein